MANDNLTRGSGGTQFPRAGEGPGRGAAPPSLAPPSLAPLLVIARAAGAAIMAYFGKDPGTVLKSDNSPLTRADLAANAVIMDGLAKAYPEIPVISEEADNPPFEARTGWEKVFIVDPLDGTREFLAGNDDFSVNIALVERGVPVFGVLYAPALDRLYCGGPGLGAFRADGDGPRLPIAAKRAAPGEPPLILVSRSHPDPGIEEYLAGFGPHRTLIMGGALKFAAVAEGAAQVYPRLRALNEWDTAAGQALLQGAGATMTGHDGSLIRYNTPDLKAGPFLARA